MVDDIEKKVYTNQPRVTKGLEGRGIDLERKLTPSELEELGYSKLSPIKALRNRWLDCCAFNSAEVRKCNAYTCPSWPFRFGKNLWRVMTDEQKKAAGDRLMALRK